MPFSKTSQAMRAGVGMGGDLGQGVFAAAESDFQPQLPHVRTECRQGRLGLLWRQRQAGQRRFEQTFLPGPQLVSARPAVEPVRRRF